MNAPAFLGAATVRRADLGAAEERGRVLAYVRAASAAQPFHLPQWLTAVERGCGQKAHYLIAERPDGSLAGVLPLSEVRSRLFGSALVSSGFAVGGGILADDEAASSSLADAAWKLARKIGCPSLELRGGPIPPGFDVAEGVYAGFVRNLPGESEAILKSIPRKQRAEIRRAQGLGLSVEIGRGQEDIAAHYRVYSESVRNLGTPVFPRELFEAMLTGFGEEADILTVRKDGRPVSSVLSFYLNGTVYPYWGGGTRDARTLRANEMLYFELMKHAAARGCLRFDFGRSKCGTGAFAYKRNWGFDPEPLAYAVRTGEGMQPRATNPNDARYRLQVALWRKLPLWAANRLGPRISRGLG